MRTLENHKRIVLTLRKSHPVVPLLGIYGPVNLRYFEHTVRPVDTGCSSPPAASVLSFRLAGQIDGGR